jgi:hypothetical protein
MPSVDPRKLVCILFLLLPGAHPKAAISMGANLWNVGWGSTVDGGQAEYNYFARNVDWAKTTDPWNPVFIEELKQAQIRTLRFMDWGLINNSTVATWDQRIPKTANHYLKDNVLPQSGGPGYGVAYEWMIDLCNKVNADMWINVRHLADTSYIRQLATLIKDNLNPDLKVYVEFSNECWNDGFAQTGWLDKQRNINGLANPLSWQGHNVYGFGNGGDCRWSEYVYHVCRTVNQFNQVFGADSKRLVRVMAGQVSWGHGTGSNQMAEYHMACLKSPICNPWGVSIDAYAIAPYWDASTHEPKGTEASMRASLADCAADMRGTLKALEGSGVRMIGYEGGADNYVTQGVANAEFQYRLTMDAMDSVSGLMQGVFNLYTFNGGDVWGLKKHVGDDPATAPKWRGYIDWLAKGTAVRPVMRKPFGNPVAFPWIFDIEGRRVDASAGLDGMGPVIFGSGSAEGGYFELGMHPGSR